MTNRKAFRTNGLSPDKFLYLRLVREVPKRIDDERKQELYQLMSVIGILASNVLKILNISNKLPASAKEVEEIFFRAYQLAKVESVDAMNTVLSHINTMRADAKFKVFTTALNTRIRRKG